MNGRISCPGGFSLEKTLLSGQCFRWTLADGALHGVARGTHAQLRQTDGYIEFSGGDEALWRDYLDLDTDYDAIRSEVVSLDPRLEQSAQSCGSVRILRQEPFEALCSFIISQNNNIPRIRLIISRLCELCGEEGIFFPTAQAIAALAEEQLTAIGCGYRAGYLLGAARAVLSGELELEPLYTMPLEQARNTLLGIRGIGPKVADCVLLYGFHRLECFPRDVWIKRALAEGLVSEAVAHSRYAGVAQQFVFEYIRTKQA